MTSHFIALGERLAPSENFRILFRFQTYTARVLKIQNGRQHTQHTPVQAGYSFIHILNRCEASLWRVRLIVRQAFKYVAPIYISPGARLSKAPETFRARKVIFRSSVCKNGEAKVYTPETSCMKRTSLHL